MPTSMIWVGDEAEDPNLPVDAQVTDSYGRLRIIETDRESDWTPPASPSPETLTLTEEIGLDMFKARSSQTPQVEARMNKWSDEGDDEQKDMPLVDDHVQVEGDIQFESAITRRFKGRISPLVVCVGGPGKLALDRGDVSKIGRIADEAFRFLRDSAPNRSVAYRHKVFNCVSEAHPVTQFPRRRPNGSLNFEPFEAQWRDDALEQLGCQGGLEGCKEFSIKQREELNATDAFIIFVTKYPLCHYAYAVQNIYLSLGLSNTEGRAMRPNVIAHEICHLFGAPDEYINPLINDNNARAYCKEKHGFYKVKNVNSVHCTNHPAPCLMGQSLAKTLCRATEYHLGFDGLETPPLVG